jgi:hypothetical protein
MDFEAAVAWLGGWRGLTGDPAGALGVLSQR